MIAAALDAYAKSSTREWSTDRSQTVGASEIGQCARRIFYAKNEDDAAQGLVRDADHQDGWGARARGSVYETHFWEPALRQAFGEHLLFAGAQQRTFIDGFLSATPDGVIVDLDRSALAHLGVEDLGSDCIVTDCKTIDPRSRIEVAKPEHVYQVQVQLGLVRRRTNYKPEYALLTYTDASFWSEVKEFAVRFDPDVFAAAEARAIEIMTASSVDQLRPEGYIAGGRECEHCPFTNACGRARHALVPDAVNAIDAETAEAIAGLARTAKELKTDADAMMAEAKVIEHEIREMLAKAGSKRLDHNGVRVQWSPVKGRPSYDMKAIRAAAEAAGVDLSPFERAGDPTDRLLITLTEIPADAGMTAAQAA